MNNRGFAISGILYTILLVFISLLIMILFNLQNKKTVLDNLKADTIYALTPEVCDSIGVKYTAYTDAVFNVTTTVGSNNEIAVITDLEINTGYISKSAPTNPVLGDIWVAISFYENAFITSTNIEVPIAHVAQYTSANKWVQKKAYISNSIVWTPLNDVAAENYVTNFAYTGAAQTFVAPASGYYKIQVWGAQGGNGNSYSGGKGGYSIGTYRLISGESIYVYVGGSGASNCTTTVCAGGYNGGGATGPNNASVYQGGGGGATHVSKANDLLKNLSVNKTSVLIVAGAGGGGSMNGSRWYGAGGQGGGLSGLIASYGGDAGNSIYPGLGGTQTAGGASPNCARPGEFGIGGGGRPDYGSGGGGGYYGGGCGWGAGGGGGSGYIGGVITYGGITATTSDGNVVFTSTTGATETGHAGNGYARITFIEIG